ncbi:VOC family protein [Shewanella psychropiezotolerans]|uniref:VOC family protein n=1 Tax=Shewanella psychropiezotolerans TaxID=2593655 RepID=A0ABX5WZE5_9GAMM|nr:MULTISPECIES: VOC family protein [Shewanella]MPY26560.1 VOC family protein [Shewanella sp. YLB-07]QDO83777.1 VOC family protein [Shewanella psychropiezotolerans]
MNAHHAINYIEMPVADISATKQFFEQVFDWEFVDYGPEYTCFTNAGIAGGFYLSEQIFDLAKGTPLVVLYSSQLEASMARVEGAGGEVSKAIFSFPGGRRFHFKDPSGNEFAIWSE